MKASFVYAALKSKVGGAAGSELDIEILDALPTTGQTGVLYLIPKTQATEEETIYNKYAWDSSKNKFIYLGDTHIEVDITGYAKLTDLADYAKLTDLQSKVDKVTGKGLTTNDLTNELKASYDQALTDISGLKVSDVEIKLLGWSVPAEMPIKNTISSDGVFHQKVGRVDLGSLDWKYSSAWGSGKEYFSVTIPIGAKYTSGSTEVKALSNLYNIVSFNKLYSDHPNKSIAFYSSTSICVVDTSYTDATTFKNAMQGKYLYYELANEISISIDGNEVVEKVNDLMYSDVEGGKNLFKIFGKGVIDSNGNYLSGGSYDNFSVTDFYDISSIKTLSWGTPVGGAYIRCIYYDSNKTFLKRNDTSSTSSGNVQLSYNNAKYVRIFMETTSSAYVPNIQIEKGSSATPYEPYIPSIKTLADKTNDLSEQIKTGAFRVAVTANTVLTVSSATILSGTLPPDFNRAYFKPISHSNSIDYDLKMTTDNGVLRIKPSKDNNISIIWTWFKNQIISV